MTRLPIRDLDHVCETTRKEVWESLAGARIFITGGTGFVGTWLVESLLRANERFELGAQAVLLTRDAERFRRANPHVAGHAAIELLTGSASDFTFPDGEFPLVIHAATEQPKPGEPCGSFDSDVAGTRHVIEFARTHGTRRLLFTSSGAAYGKQPPELTHVPEDYPGAPLTTDAGSAYGQAKRVSEFLCTMHGRQYGFDPLIARLFAFVGPLLPLDANYAVGNFVRDVLAGEPIRIKGDGTPYRSYLYAADMAVWLWTILVHGAPERPYNVGSGAAVSIAELASTVAETLRQGTRVEIAGRPIAGMPSSRYVPCVDRAASELSLAPVIPLDEGVRRTFGWACEKSSITVNAPA